VTYGYVSQIIEDKNFREMDINSYITKKASKKLMEATAFVSTARTYVRKNYHGDIEDQPEVEAPTRLYSSICKLVSIHAYINKRTKVNKRDIKFGIRILHDNIPTRYLLAMNVLLKAKKLKNKSMTTPMISEIYKLPNTTVRRILFDLEALGILKHNQDINYENEGQNTPYEWEYVYPEKNLNDESVITTNSKYLIGD